MRPHPFHRRSQRVAECRREDCDVSVAVSVEVGVLINDRDRITFTLGENGTGEPPRGLPPPAISACHFIISLIGLTFCETTKSLRPFLDLGRGDIGVRDKLTCSYNGHRHVRGEPGAWHGLGQPSNTNRSASRRLF